MNDLVNKALCKSIDKYGFGTQRICASIRLADDSEYQYLNAVWFYEQPDRIYLRFSDEFAVDEYLANERLVKECLYLLNIKKSFRADEDTDVFDGAIMLSSENKADYNDEIHALARVILNTALEQKLYYEFDDYWQWVEDWAGDVDCEEPIEYNKDAWTEYEEYVNYVNADGMKLALYEMEMLIQGKKVYLGYIQYSEFPNARLCYVSFSKVLAKIIKKYGKDESVVDRDTVKDEILRSANEIKRQRDIRSSKYRYYLTNCLSIERRE